MKAASMPSRRIHQLGTALVAVLAISSHSVGAQDQGGVDLSREVVQPLPPDGTSELGDALRRLALNPNDLEALLDAGGASLRLNDIDAAVGFYGRAEALGTGQGRAKAGLAAAQVYKKKPVEALRLFAEAESMGASMSEHASDYGLALDLVGDNVRAQQYYAMALEQGPSAEVTRRLALSQAISGNQNASETTLLPLLQRRDLAAYRSRAFALAVLGKTDEAVAIAEAVMPASLASRIAPYLRYMPRLTRAQQAAAANFGHFPEAAAIGRDDPRIAEYARAAAIPAAAPPPSGSRLVPSGAPLGQATRPAPPPVATQIAVVQPQAANTGELPPARPQAPAPAPAPSVSIARPPEQQATPEPASLSDAFSDFSSSDPVAEPAPGAVDVTAIEPARAEPKKAEPPKPVNPSRIWVQVATGRDRSALRFDWRRLTRKAPGLLSGRDGFIVDWGRTNRLVTGPFPNKNAAQDFVTELKRAGIDSFQYTSKSGEAVNPIGR